MNRTLFAFVLLTASGCKQDASSTTTTSSAAASTAATPTPSPFIGTLTSDRIMGAKDTVQPLQAWPAAQAKLEAQLGKATVVKNDKYMWGVSQGDDCWYIEVDKQADGTVGMVMNPMKVSKGGPIMNWDDCLTAAGVRKDAVEDPNAPGPPADKAISIAELRDGATKARSKWDKAKVTVRALYLNTSSSTMNGVESTSAMITGAKGDLKNAMSCALVDPKSLPPKLLQYDPLTVTGTLRVSDMLTGAGDRVLGLSLDDCSVVSTKK